jgi:flagellum-specific peptidoglycan hydrolase FlgJ
METRRPLPSLAFVRSCLALLLLCSLGLLGSQPLGVTVDSTQAPPPTVRASTLSHLERARGLSLSEPDRGLPMLAEIASGAAEQDLRERAAVLLMDGISRHPASAPAGVEATLREIYVTTEDEGLRQRALLFLLARQLEELPPGAQGSFLAAILPQVIQSARAHRLPPSVTLAQAVHESGWGRSRLARDHKNLFGVKASRGQAAVSMATHEHQDGSMQRMNSRFRSFEGLGESIEEHARLLAGDRRYAQARASWLDWRGFLQRLAPRYATDPAYAQRIAHIVERYDLDRWDALVQAAALYDAGREDEADQS